MNKWKMENGKWKILLMFFPFILSAENFTQIKSEITNSLKYKMQEKKIKIFEEKLKSVKAKNYGTLDLEYNAVHLFKQPVMKMDSMQPVKADTTTGNLVYVPVHSELPMSDKNHFTGVLKYSYPLFTGFAITNMIEKSKLELIKEKINLNNVKRVLTLNAAKLYSNIYALKAKINALEKAKAALLSAKEKAESFYKEGLLNKASVDEIDAKYYEIIALIKETKAQKSSLLNLLSYLINKKVSKIDAISVQKYNLPPKFENRPDIKAIKETLKIKDKDIKLAKSKYYPQIGVEAGIKREADNVVLSDNDYQNIDKSYIALGVKYNLFDAGEKKATLQMAKLAKSTYMIYYKDYLNQVKTNYQNDLDTLKALFYRLKAAKEEVEARESYYEYIRAKFEEGLEDSSDLNDAIAKLAEARAKKEAIKAQIFFLNVKLKLNGGYDE